MIFRRTRAGFILALSAAVLLGGCMQMLGYPTTGATGSTEPTQASASPGGTSEMDGAWKSNDGVFVASFEDGNFTSRFTKTNEVLAQGTYTVSGSSVSMKWVSVASQQQRSATCTIAAPDTVNCSQDGGGTFDLKRAT